MTATKLPPISDSSIPPSPTTTTHGASLTPHSSGTNTPNTLQQDRELLFDSEDIEALLKAKDQDDLPNYEASISRAKDIARCEILPSRVAVWTVRDTGVKLSAFVAAILLHQGLLSVKDLDVYESKTLPSDPGPRDPITGLFTSLHSTVGGVIQGLIDYPIEISKIVQADGDVAHGLAKDFALDSNKGISRIIGTGLRAPMDFTMNISRGFGNVPRLYGDETVRGQESERVDGLASGVGAAGKGFGLSLYDGITGLYTQPLKGAETGGVSGFFAGLGKGIGGAVFKPVAGAVGIPALAFKGVYEELSTLVGGSQEDQAREQRIQQGNEEWEMCTVEERRAVLGMWEAFRGQEGKVQGSEVGRWN